MQCMITHSAVSENKKHSAPKVSLTLPPPIPKINEDLKYFFLTTVTAKSPFIIVCK